MSNLKKVDPLNLLKESFTEKKPIIVDQNLLIFYDKTALKLETMTAWEPPEDKKRYSIGDLWLFLSVKAEKRPSSEYFSKLSDFKKIFPAQMISFQHRGNLNR